MSTAPAITVLELTPVECASPFQAFCVPDLAFPLSGEVRRPIVDLVKRLLAAAEKIGLTTPALWLDTQQLHQDGGSKVYGSHARQWSPAMGFCFDPSEAAPRKLRFDDLLNMEYGTQPKLADRSCIFVSNVQQSFAAYEVMGGRGVANLLCFREADTLAAAQRYMQHTQKTLKRYMAEGEFQNFKYYFPLLTSGSVAQASAQQLSEWLAEADLYLRESPETKELVIVGGRSLEHLLETAGLQRTGYGEVSPWALHLPQQTETGEIQ
ncbi:hypothetical protein FTW19_10235 [Terriglobus albidus]|uniref:Uncharacterized protein n=1 Tax=Terriglobus albidus TaxID=1592106 RepID=A0A5B9E7W2_9BACT|nr:hypothetical protein [Terriglobus albidus]QEE28343.1 hypothetical protein FTW19_10235 [Terriglobus albidus]